MIGSMRWTVVADRLDFAIMKERWRSIVRGNGNDIRLMSSLRLGARGDGGGGCDAGENEN